MKIKHLRIQGYRSLYDVELKFQPLTVLVGANNAGKSNLIEALSFLASVYQWDFEPAINSRGGFPHVAFRRGDDPLAPICFEVKASLDSTEMTPLFSAADAQASPSSNGFPAPREFQLRHSFELEPSVQHLITGFSVVKEEIDVSIHVPGQRTTHMRFNRRDADLKIELPRGKEFAPALLQETFREKKALRSVLEDVASNSSSMLPRLRLVSPLINAFVSNLALMRPYRLLPSLGRSPGTPSASGDVLADGQNLPALIAYLQERERIAWEATNQALATLDPTLEEVRVAPDYDRRLRLEFIELETRRTWTANEVSDGTIRALAMFAAVNDPRWKVQLIEELENSLHPWALRAFVDACRSVTLGEKDLDKQKQIVLTTHSPVLLDSVRPEQVVVVWRDERKTSLRPLVSLDPDAAKLWAEGDTTIAELIDSAWVREAVPGGVG